MVLSMMNSYVLCVADYFASGEPSLNPKIGLGLIEFPDI